MLRLRLRREAYLVLFCDPAVGGPYLASRGHAVKRAPNEDADAYRNRLKEECTKFCLRQFKGEFGRLHWLLPMSIASIVTFVAVVFLVCEAFGTPLRADTPRPVIFALLGGMVWNFYVAFRDYTRTDLSPATFYWISFRFLLALALGVLAENVFTDAFANVGVFVLAMLPFSEAISFIRAKIPGLAAEEAAPKLKLLQGLAPENEERLKELGVQTVQQLAYADPLRLLLGSNLSAKILIDWMDQALLYIYLGEKTSELRSRGIRGSIETAMLWEEQERNVTIPLLSKCVGLTPEEFAHLTKTIHDDTQVMMLWRIWGTLDPDQAIR
jgi:hypothetical protein